MKRYFVLAVALTAAAACTGPSSVSSPDGHIKVDFALSDGVPYYSVSVDGKPFIEQSRLGIAAAESDLSGTFSSAGSSLSSHDEVWTQPWGENKSIRDRHNELRVNLKNGSGVRLAMIFRVFDDGLGFRYEYEVPGTDTVRVNDELTEFNFASDARSWSIPGNFDTYELTYRDLPLSAVEDANTPVTFRTEDGIYASVHEAALVDYPEMTLRKTSGTRFTSALAPLPDGVKAVVGGTFKTPWRTVQISDSAVGLINSALILNLNDPCVLEDTDWIRPMKYVGVWWGMHLGINSWTADARHGATTSEAFRYIDFAAANNIEGVLFEGWNDGWDTWGARQDFDFTSPAKDFDIRKVTQYAASKGVSYILHHETGGNVPNYERQLDTALAWAAEMGIHALKTGYAGGMPGGNLHHSQYGVRHYQKVIDEAAKYKIMVDAHEPIKPTGLRRTYPNFMTREGARGMEWNAWSDGNAPEHLEILPYTRLLAGPMDYTPGTFDILFENIKGNPNLRQWNMKPATECRVHTTLAKQLADWVIIYSPLQMASDLIENYEGHPAFRFFRDFDADCDWSEALQGEIGEYVAVVRRAGDRFFYGATTDSSPRTLVQPLSFLEDGKDYTAVIYADGEDADWLTNPQSYEITERTVTSADTLEVRMAAGGGQAITFIPCHEQSEKAPGDD